MKSFKTSMHICYMVLQGHVQHPLMCGSLGAANGEAALDWLSGWAKLCKWSRTRDKVTCGTHVKYGWMCLLYAF
jgi:hypothetical protein